MSDTISEIRASYSWNSAVFPIYKYASQRTLAKVHRHFPTPYWLRFLTKFTMLAGPTVFMVLLIVLMGNLENPGPLVIAAYKDWESLIFLLLLSTWLVWGINILLYKRRNVYFWQMCFARLNNAEYKASFTKEGLQFSSLKPDLQPPSSGMKLIFPWRDTKFYFSEIRHGYLIVSTLHALVILPIDTLNCDPKVAVELISGWATAN